MASDAALGITYDASGWLTNYGKFAYGPNIIVVHSLECDAIRGIAHELSAPGGWLDTENLAPQRMTAPSDLVRSIPDGDQGGHIGGPGNSHCAGVEVSGRAAWTAAEWGTPLAVEGLQMQARAIAGLAVVYGWTYGDLRWLSQAQIKAGSPKGLCTHNDISISGISNTNHWDPGLSYPFAWFLSRVQAWFLIITGGTPPPNNPDGWLDMGAREDILTAINYGNDKIMQGKAGEVPNYNLKDTYTRLEQLSGKLDQAAAAASAAAVAALQATAQQRVYSLARAKETGAVYAYSPGVWYHVHSGADLELGRLAGIYPEAVLDTDDATCVRLRDLCLPTDNSLYVPPVPAS